jgi:hypothetical protein
MAHEIDELGARPRWARAGDRELRARVRQHDPAVEVGDSTPSTMPRRIASSRSRSTRIAASVVWTSRAMSPSRLSSTPMLSALGTDRRRAGGERGGARTMRSMRRRIAPESSHATPGR